MATDGKLPLYNAIAQTDVDMNSKKLLSLDTSNLPLLPSQTGNSGKFVTTNGTAASWANAVTSVALTAPSMLSVAGSPITTTGTLALTLASQSANTVLAGPTSGGAAAPTFRAPVTADIPNLDFAKITTGTVPVAQGGTNLASYAVGDLLYASGATALSKLADVATGNALISGGVTTAPAWGKITSAHADTSLLKASNNLSDVSSSSTSRNNILPTQSAQSGKFLTTDGTNATWATVTGSGAFTSFSFVDANGFHGSVANASSAPALTLSLADSGDNTKTASFDLSNIATGTNRAINVPNASSTTAQTKGATANQFLTAMSGQGVFSAAQPAVANISDFNASVAPAFVTLTDGATVTLTCDATKAIQNAKVTLGGNRTLAISGATNGMSGILEVIQDGTGNRTLTLPATSKVVNGGAGAATLSATAGAVDFLCWEHDGSSIFWTKLPNFT